MATAGDFHPSRNARRMANGDTVPDGGGSYKRDSFPTSDFLLTLLSFGTGTAGLVMNFILVVKYYQLRSMTEFYFTVGTLCASAFVCGVVSFQWSCCIDDETTALRKGFYTAAGFLKLGALSRRVEKLVNMVIGYCKNDYNIRLREEEDRINDADFIGLFEVYLEDAPQLLLQLYLFFVSDFSLGIRDALIVADCVLIPYSLTSSYMTNKQADPYHDTPDTMNKILGIITYTLWRAAELGPRLALIALLLVYVGPMFFLSIALHVAFMVVLNITIFKPISNEFCCHPSLLYIWSSYLGIYHFFNMQGRSERSRHSGIIYYIIFYVENMFMALLVIDMTFNGLWEFRPWCYSAFSVIPGFFLHMIFEFIFYRFFLSPSKSNESEICNGQKRKEVDVEETIPRKETSLESKE